MMTRPNHWSGTLLFKSERSSFSHVLEESSNYPWKVVRTPTIAARSLRSSVTTSYQNTFGETETREAYNRSTRIVSIESTLRSWQPTRPLVIETSRSFNQFSLYWQHCAWPGRKLTAALVNNGDEGLVVGIQSRFVPQFTTDEIS